MHKMDYLIVGQGLAGTLVAHFLRKAGASLRVLDAQHPRASSRAAAGVMNPVTGRHFVKTWMMDGLFPYAKLTYQHIEAELGIRCFYERNVLRSFGHQQENELLLRFSRPEYEGLVSVPADLGSYAQHLKQADAYCEISNAAQVDLPTLLSAFKNKLQQERLFEEGDFEVGKMAFKGSGVIYNNIEYKKIIFCEGQWARLNPYWQHLPFEMSKGEALEVEIRSANFEKMLKQNIYIVPLPNGHYWVGATNARYETDDAPTAAALEYLEGQLSATINLDFSVVRQLSAIRPTVRDRRPLLGLHPQHPQLAIFNGLGTKGASLGPYWAYAFADFLRKGTSLDAAVDIARFQH
jgi:glycine oxidase